MSTHLLRFPATVAGLEKGGVALRALLDEQQVHGGPRYNVELVFDEIGGNIVRHGRATHDIELAVGFQDHEVVLIFEDDGVPFDPREAPAPARPSALEDAGFGGLGLMLVRRVASRMDYERTRRASNRLVLAVSRG